MEVQLVLAHLPVEEETAPVHESGLLQGGPAKEAGTEAEIRKRGSDRVFP